MEASVDSSSMMLSGNGTGTGTSDPSGPADTLSGSAASVSTLQESTKHHHDQSISTSSSTSTIKKLYGRSTEARTLLETYQGLLKTKKAQTVLVHGESGCGKTSLIETLRVPVYEWQGYFVTGKYFQNPAFQEPYSAVMAAFSDLCDLVSQSDDFDKLRQQEIADALDSDTAPQLIRAVTNILQFTDKAILRESESEVPSAAKFKIACTTFLQTMACDKHPVVVFLDDIQWADEGSSQLIQTLLQDLTLDNVMFVLAYRDDEERSDHFESILARVRNPIDIQLSNLDAASVHQLVTSSLGSNTEQIKQLSHLITRRTSGSPLYANTFIDVLMNDSLLEYDSNTESWIFDVEQIQKQIMVHETLADLYTRQIEGLSSDIKEVLTVASVLGYSFNGSVLQKVASIVMEEKERLLCLITEHPMQDRSARHNSITALLSDAEKLGFIEKTNTGYHFPHDKVQSAFLALVVDKSEEAMFHQIIGEVFLSQREEDASSIYKAAVHLNRALNPDDDDAIQRTKLARVNLEASRYCEERSAFIAAVAMLRAGVEFLSPIDHWAEPHYSLTFDIMEFLARMQLIIGDYKACKETTREASLHCKSAEMKLKLQLIDVEVRMAGNEVDAALLRANTTLMGLGVKMPRKASFHHNLAKLMKVKFMLRWKKDDDILNLPFAQDAIVENAVKLLMHVSSFCFVKDEAHTAIFSSLLAVELTLKHGLSTHSSSAFAVYGVAEAFLGNADRAYQVGKLALAIYNHSGSREAECHTLSIVHTMLTFYHEPMHDLVDPLYHAAQWGYQHGDVIYGAFCLSQAFSMYLHVATPLSDLEQIMRTSYGKVCELHQVGMAICLQPIMQYVLNLQSDAPNWEKIAVLSGEIMNEEVFLGEAMEMNNLMLVMFLYLAKAHIAVLFDQFTLASSLFSKSKSFGADITRLTYLAPVIYFDLARTHYGLFESSGKHRHLRKARNYKKRLHRMDVAGCPEAYLLHVYLIAQDISLVRFVDNDKLLAAHNRGIACLAEAKAYHYEGMLNEKAGFDCAKRGMRAEAEHYFQRAQELYCDKWGATAKAEWLQEKSAIALSQLSSTHTLNDLPGLLIDVLSSGERGNNLIPGYHRN